YHTNIRIDRMTDADWVAREKLHGLGQQQALFEPQATADSNEVIDGPPTLAPPVGGAEAAAALFRAEHKTYYPDDDDA
ncbi:MAG: hypothetical protein ACRDAM_18055, partial [Casimicrobium sp.]